MPHPPFALPLSCLRSALRLLCVAGAALGALALPVQAQAQVLRCTDARTGAVSYTDGACNAGSKVQEVEPRRSEADIERDRAQAEEALARKKQRLQSEAAADRLDAERGGDMGLAGARTTDQHHIVCAVDERAAMQLLD